MTKYNAMRFPGFRCATLRMLGALASALCLAACMTTILGFENHQLAPSTADAGQPANLPDVSSPDARHPVDEADSGEWLPTNDAQAEASLDASVSGPDSSDAQAEAQGLAPARHGGPHIVEYEGCSIVLFKNPDPNGIYGTEESLWEMHRCASESVWTSPVKIKGANWSEHTYVEPTALVGRNRPFGSASEDAGASADYLYVFFVARCFGGVQYVRRELKLQDGRLQDMPWNRPLEVANSAPSTTPPAAAMHAWSVDGSTTPLPTMAFADWGNGGQIHVHVELHGQWTRLAVDPSAVSKADAGPTLVSFKGSLFVLYNSVSDRNQPYYVRLANNSVGAPVWDDPKPIGVPCSYTPRVAEWNGMLLAPLRMQVAGASHLALASWVGQPLGRHKQPVGLNALSDERPSIAVFGNTARVAFRHPALPTSLCVGSITLTPGVDPRDSVQPYQMLSDYGSRDCFR